jgi:hypothetical protein
MRRQSLIVCKCESTVSEKEGAERTVTVCGVSGNDLFNDKDEGDKTDAEKEHRKH